MFHAFTSPTAYGRRTLSYANEGLERAWGHMLYGEGMEMKYCMYLRKSRADREAEQRGEGETLARHEQALQDLARRQMLPVSQVFREIGSGETIAHRPVMAQLLREVEQGRWTGVLVMEVERLARGDTMDQGRVAKAFGDSGTKIITPIKTYDPLDEFDEEYFEFGLFMSRREYKMINRRLQRGRLASVREGKYVGSGSPYGYRRSKLPGDKGYTLEPVEEQAAVVALLYRWFVHGEDGNTVSVPSMAERLNSWGIPGPGGGAWAAATIREMLQNPLYAGTIRWNWRPVRKQTVAGQTKSTRPRSGEPILVQGLHPAIVEPGLWGRAQERFQTKDTARIPSLKNPLAGIVECGLCGHSLIRKPSRDREPDLACGTPGCPTMSHNLKEVEELLLEALELWLGEFTTTADGTDRPESGERIRGQIKKELEKSRQQLGRLHDLLEQGIYDAGTFRERCGALKQRIGALEMAANVAEPEAINAAENSVPLFQIYREAGPARKNALMRELVQRVTYRKSLGGRWRNSDLTLEIYPRLRP